MRVPVPYSVLRDVSAFRVIRVGLFGIYVEGDCGVWGRFTLGEGSLSVWPCGPSFGESCPKSGIMDLQHLCDVAATEHSIRNTEY